MKYYAVTEDPNELLHYGVKGMKWGQHIFGDKPKSSGYKKALGKLRTSAKKTAAPKAPKTSTQKRMTNNANQQNAYRNAARKEKANASLIARLNASDNDRKYYNQMNRELKREQKISKAMQKAELAEKKAQVGLMRQQARAMQKAANNEAHFDKIMKQARQGKLKYGNLSAEQVQRVQNRLQMEENARRLGAKERTWHQQKKEARREGKLLGITKGTAAAMEEVARAGTKYGINHLLNRTKLKTAARQEGKIERIKNKQRNKKSARDIRREVDEQILKERFEDGESLSNIIARKPWLSKDNAEYMKNKRIADEQKKIQEFERNALSNVFKTRAAKTDEKVSDIYKSVYGKEMPKFDQPKTNENESLLKQFKNATKRDVSIVRKKFGNTKDVTSKAWNFTVNKGYRNNVINDIKIKTDPNKNYYNEFFDDSKSRRR